MFDVPAAKKSRLEWKVDLPIEDRPWQVGLIVGPSGCGKTQIARRVWADKVDPALSWDGRAVVDNFSTDLNMETVSGVCMAVGFNTIPSWMRPHAVLSNGEQFRVDLARRLAEGGPLVVVDEFTSVVDRQVAQIASHAVQKFIRKQQGRQFVAVTCHYDVIDWLQPDWTYDPSTQSFAWRSLQRRPELDITISPIPYAGWKVFAPYHYLTASLHHGARCFGLFVNGRLAAFAGMLHRVGANHRAPIMGCSRLVTLPDFQGLGLAFVLIDTVGSIYRAVGKRVHTYPAHPALIRGFDKSTQWSLQKRPGQYVNTGGSTSTLKRRAAKTATRAKEHGNELGTIASQGGRPCAVFRYEGPPADRDEAERILGFWGTRGKPIQ